MHILEYENKKLEEFNNYLKGRKVAVIGLGVSNIPLISYLHDLKSEVTVFDNKEIDQIDNDLINQINIQITKLFTNCTRTCKRSRKRSNYYNRS